jgi:tRNA(Ile)-lysidine synthase
MDPGELNRFAADLDALNPPRARLGEGDHSAQLNGGGASFRDRKPLGLAVSGGPDSLALLLLAHAARPGKIEAATVDHRLRPTARVECEAVADICANLGIPHAILTARWATPPTANLQAEARAERYALFGQWATSRALTAVATAHHADDQAETLLMRLARGSGVGGLASTRPSRPLTGIIPLIRPLLGWRKAELEAIVVAAGLAPADDPANHDPRHDRTRVRAMLADFAPDAAPRLAASATWLREADDALDWSLARLDRIRRDGDSLCLDPTDLPRELQRRLLLAAFATLAAPAPRGPDLARAIAALTRGDTVTLGPLKLSGGAQWHIRLAPPRTPR